MEFLSREYGWTPDEIKRQSNADIENYLTIISIRNTISNFKKRYGG